MATTTGKAAEPKREPEPRWPSALAVLGIGGLYLALPSSLSVGPDWLLLVIVAILLLSIYVARRRKHVWLNQVLGYILNGVVTAALILSLASLVRSLPGHQLAPEVLLRSAVALWVTNILVFASWYWRLDAGGPHARDLREAHTQGDFLFAQMTIDPEKSPLRSQSKWSPGFVDYLFLAFNTSTAFSPTDVPVLSRWAKLLMMLQSTISFATVALLAARAINIL